MTTAKSKFGDFSLGIDKSASGGTLTTAGVAIYAKRGDSDTAVGDGGQTVFAVVH